MHPTLRLSTRPATVVRTAPAAALAAALAAVPTPSARAQLPGIPSAPSAFVRPGIAVAANAGVERVDGGATSGGGTSSRTGFGAAAGFAPRSGRWQVAGGAGVQRWGDGYDGAATTFGGRLTVPVLHRPRFGLAAVAGAGFARAKLAAPPAGAPQPDDSAEVSVRQIPIGAALGMRGAFGTRAWAVSVAPQFVWYASSVGGQDLDGSARARIGGVAEVAVTPRVGLSLAYEDGARAGASTAGPRGGTLGVAVAFAFGGGG